MSSPIPPARAASPFSTNRCLLPLSLKGFQTMTWPALWTAATARTRRKVSTDVQMFSACTVAARTVISNNQPPRKHSAHSSTWLPVGKGGLSHGARGTQWFWPLWSLCQWLEVLICDAKEALHLHLPPETHVSTITWRANAHPRAVSTSLHLPSTMRPPMVGARRETSSNR